MYLGLPWYPYPYYGYGYPYYGYSYPAYSYSAPVAVESAPAYVQQNPQPQQYWYYCTGPSQGYYPYVKECPSGWLQVVPQPSEPPAPR